MSTIRVDNFGPSAGGTTYSARGIAKAWVNFNGTGTIAARDSDNLSSLTDRGTGKYTINMTSAMGAADYSVVIAGSKAYNDTDDGNNTITVGTASTIVITSSSFPITNQTPSVGTVDNPHVFASTHGDLA